jgi:hypothetical protein
LQPEEADMLPQLSLAESRQNWMTGLIYYPPLTSLGMNIRALVGRLIKFKKNQGHALTDLPYQM